MIHQGISLLELNQLVKNTLDLHLDTSYWVIGEIADLNLARQGHAYLELVEKQGNQIVAKIRANIWAYSYRSIASKFEGLAGQTLKPGMKILALASVTFHEIYGLSLQIKEIDPNYTIGERARIKQEILDRLQEEGLINLNKGLILPTVPQNIALISSATAAGYGDFVNQLGNNRYQYKINHQLFQATLQGAEAAKTMILAIQKIQDLHQSQPFDAILIIRGGGAQLDLDCFDDYLLAVAIAQSPIPVITGIGHERDETIADLVAHTKMKTPTATAEFLLSGFREFEDSLDQLSKQLERNAAQIWLAEEKKLANLENQLKKIIELSLQRSQELLHFTTRQIKTLLNQNFSIFRLQVATLTDNLEKSSLQRIKTAKEYLERHQKDIGRLNPQYFMDMGYTRSEINGKPIHLTSLKKNDEIITYTSKSKISSKVTKVETYGKR
jgi:exodeoxyribonuclease VII large subunit